MAMRQTGGGSSASADKRRAPQSQGVRPVYEDFKPMSEWRQDDDSLILNIHLPGFMKEQIKVSAQDPNTIIVQGKRLVAGNKWSRFHEEFQVPGELNSLQVKYEEGILSIKVLKKEVENPRGPPKPLSVVESSRDPREPPKSSYEVGSPKELPKPPSEVESPTELSKPPNEVKSPREPHKLLTEVESPREPFELLSEVESPGDPIELPKPLSSEIQEQPTESPKENPKPPIGDIHEKPIGHQRDPIEVSLEESEISLYAKEMMDILNVNESQESLRASNNPRMKRDRNGDMKNGESCVPLLKDRHEIIRTESAKLNEERQSWPNIRLDMIVIVALIAYVMYNLAWRAN